MATAVFFHAHPDDEAIATGGTMVLGARRGHRIVLVCATDGAVGEADPDVIPAGETLADVRARDLAAAADELSVDRLEFLGYKDSGMEGTDTNADPACFWQADVEEAAERLAQILREEQASIVTIYDPIGGYRHPDHIQVHRVGKRAAELAGTPHVFESTMNREQMKSFADQPEWAEMGEGDNPMTDDEIEAQRQDFLEQDLGTPAADITHAVDVTSVIPEKKAAMIAHASQITEDSVFLKLPDDAFAMAFGQEWFVQYGADQAGEPYLDDIYAVLGDGD
ncbi:MAG: PIG-L family deacetylase [Actinomycetota bacterium]